MLSRRRQKQLVRPRREWDGYTTRFRGDTNRSWPGPVSQLRSSWSE